MIQNQINQDDCIENYNLVQEIGQGNYGIIYKAHKINSPDDIIAIKKIERSKIDKDKKLVEQFQNEITIMKSLKHENICQLFSNFQDSNNYYLVIEYCNQSNLKEYVKKFGIPGKNYVNEDKAINIMRQILNAFRQFSQRDQIIIHRDIKMENILMHNELVKLADFGFSRYLQGNKQLATTEYGTMIYMAPEILNSQQYDSKVDIYSLGVLFYLLLTGEYPFKSKQREKLPGLIKKQQLEYLDKSGEEVQISSEIQQLIQDMLCYNPNDRISFQQLFNHDNFKFPNSKLSSDIQKLKIISKKNKQPYLNYQLKSNLSQLNESNNSTYKKREKKITRLAITQEDQNNKIQSNIKINLDFWDTTGQELFNSTPPSYYRESDMFLIIFDFEKDSSVLRVENILLEIQNHCVNTNVFRLILANKSDLKENCKFLEEIEMQKLQWNDIFYQEISVEQNQNIMHTFRKISCLLSQVEPFKKPNQNSLIVKEKNCISCGGCSK